MILLLKLTSIFFKITYSVLSHVYMLCIALIEIGNRRIYIQWLWIPLSGHPFGLPESSELLFENPQASPKGVNKKNEQGRANSSLIFSQEFLLFHISSPFWALEVLRDQIVGRSSPIRICLIQNFTCILSYKESIFFNIIDFVDYSWHF